MSWFSRMFRQGFSVTIDDRQPCFTYREGKRKMLIAGEIIADGYAIYAASIKRWESQAGGEPVDDAERQRIASNVQQYLISKGKNVYVSSGAGSNTAQ